MIELIACGSLSDARGILASLHGKRVALGELRGFFFVQDGGMAGENRDSAAVVEIVEAEGAFAVRDHGEITAGHAEIVLAGGIHVEGSGTLTENETRGASTVIERKVVKFEDGVRVEKSHRAIFEFDFGAAGVGGHNVALPDR